MAIAFDAASQNDFGNTSSQTLAHTISGSNRILMVGVGHNNSASDLVTGITYDSVAMTRIATSSGGATMRTYLYYIVAPNTGTHNIVVSMSSAAYTKVIGSSYTGASQTGQPDSSNTNAGVGTSLSISTTVVANNSWTVGFFGGAADQTVIGTGSGEAIRAGVPAGVGDCYQLGDSNADLAAGSRTLACTCALQEESGIVASISPVAAAATYRRLLLLGAGA